MFIIIAYYPVIHPHADNIGDHVLLRSTEHNRHLDKCDIR